MRLALQTDYALRILMYLAHHGQRAKASDVAKFYGISGPHVAKVVNQLARLGYVRSVRGAGGGIQLARTPAAINIAEVLLDFEGNLHLLECTATEGVCVIERFCKLKTTLAEAERLQMEYLRGVTLDDVMPKRKQMELTALQP